MKSLLAALALAALVAAGPSAARTDASSPSKRYAVAFADATSVPANAEAIVAKAGGRIVSRLGPIGGVIAVSSDAGFAGALQVDPQVASVSEDTVRSLIPRDLGSAPARRRASATVPGADPLYSQQWDKQRVHASPDGSYRVQRGRRGVVVAVLDTGADLAHPDIAPNLDLARSRSFVPAEPELDDHNGHGTWALSAVGAPINGVGVSGVAPNVTLVALKVFDTAGNGSFGDVAQALVYAGQSRFDVASMSFGAYFDEKGQRADVKLIERALRFARSNGVVLLAAAGNDNVDLVDKKATKGIVELPAEGPGVVAVSATGFDDRKAYYSNYGTGVVDVAAPGGDRRFQTPPASIGGGGRVLGAWSSEAIASVPADLREQSCKAGEGCGWYVWMQGTSMATPNAAGVAALIVSQSSQRRATPADVELALERTATPLPCPANPFNPGPPFEFVASCDGNRRTNGFYGHGLVDALRAVSTG